MQYRHYTPKQISEMKEWNLEYVYQMCREQTTGRGTVAKLPAGWVANKEGARWKIGVPIGSKDDVAADKNRLLNLIGIVLGAEPNTLNRTLLERWAELGTMLKAEDIIKVLIQKWRVAADPDEDNTPLLSIKAFDHLFDAYRRVVQTQNDSSFALTIHSGFTDDGKKGGSVSLNTIRCSYCQKKTQEKLLPYDIREQLKKVHNKKTHRLLNNLNSLWDANISHERRQQQLERKSLRTKQMGRTKTPTLEELEELEKALGAHCRACGRALTSRKRQYCDNRQYNEAPDKCRDFYRKWIPKLAAMSLYKRTQAINKRLNEIKTRLDSRR